MHAILAEVELDAEEAGVSVVALAQGRIVGASPVEIEAGAAAAKSALLHPIMRRAAASDRRGECRREAPILLPLDDGTMIEGVIDLAFREMGAAGPEWTVVDFKTDVELTERRAKYETQILLYVKAISAATGSRRAGCCSRCEGASGVALLILPVLVRALERGEVRAERRAQARIDDARVELEEAPGVAAPREQAGVLAQDREGALVGGREQLFERGPHLAEGHLVLDEIAEEAGARGERGSREGGGEAWVAGADRPGAEQGARGLGRRGAAA